MATLIPAQMRAGVDSAKTVTVARNFDGKLLFLGAQEEPLRLCQQLMERLINSSDFSISKPSISVLSMMPEIMRRFPTTMQSHQVVGFGKKFDVWSNEDMEGVVFVTNYDALKFEGLQSRREIPVEEFLEEKKFKRSRLFGVIYQRVEPKWISCIKSAEIYNFKKRLAGVLRITTERVYYLQTESEMDEFLLNIMAHIYRWREDEESEENAKIVRGEIERSKATIDKELLEPVTMLYGDLPDKNGITLSEGV